MDPRIFRLSLVPALLAALAANLPAAEAEARRDGSKIAPAVIFEPGPYYADEARMFQGIPGLERSPGGRLWVTWYGGGVTEDHDRIKASCTKPGMVYIITPSEGRNKDTLEPQLLAKGYKKTDLDEFLLFGTTGGNVCSVFQKRVDAGESIEFGKWGILAY